MNLRRVIGLAVIVLFSCTFWYGYNAITSAQKEVAIQQTQQEEQVEETKNTIYYELHKAEAGHSMPASVFVNDEKIVTFTQIAGGLTPRERASILVDRLLDFKASSGDPKKIEPGFERGIAVSKFEDKVLFTADVKSARSLGLSVSQLAYYWTNNVRQAFGADPILRDHNLLKVIAENPQNLAEYREVGVASWYGGYFHGRTAADGSIYNMYEFTAAHKYLPFGSIVKVTNLTNNDSCVVKITDRGPFIKNRIIDLSKVAAEEIGMLEPGTSQVEIEVIGRV